MEGIALNSLFRWHRALWDSSYNGLLLIRDLRYRQQDMSTGAIEWEPWVILSKSAVC